MTPIPGTPVLRKPHRNHVIVDQTFCEPRMCVQCYKRFVAVDVTFICCSPYCSHAHKQELRASLEEGYLPYPF